MLPLIERSFLQITHWLYARLPQPASDLKRLRECRIISHRGEHDNQRIMENTLPAFDRILACGAWGIEFDVRWTKDLHPVIFHDSDLKRLFNANAKICDLQLADLKHDFPAIPTLEAVVERYGNKLHLMVEIKKERFPDPERQNQILANTFKPLQPSIDFHCMSLYPEIFTIFRDLPPEAFLPIARANVHRFSDLALANHYGGVTGHFLLLSNRILAIHHQNGSKVGTGFIESINCLFRELNRSVDWIFSNRAVFIQSICDRFKDPQNTT